MCYAIPIFADRVAPRCTIAEFILFLVLKGNRIVSRKRINLKDCTWIELIRILIAHETDILVCGGINKETREMVESHGIMIIDNVCCSNEQAQHALENGSMHSGFGFSEANNPKKQNSGSFSRKDDQADKKDSSDSAEFKPAIPDLETIDCLACEDKVCLRGEVCRPGLRKNAAEDDPVTRTMLESSLDVMAEKERTLCRLTELIYFCLGMKYRKIGIAFCIDMFEQTEILVNLLRRFFEVYPVCCKIGGNRTFDPHTGSIISNDKADFSNISCNPVGQAKMLNKIGTDINIIVGLCMGVDCIFSRESKAPVSTLFVKDKSLAHNPIGALYSDYYLKEITKTKVGKT
ncbi:MAG TPA: DUF1847 domain-containing protein [candidate division Zixibacteria bacterium]|nr:DUF1847 domain-containing protein [candidate division Zixibacteria bacterium]